MYYDKPDKLSFANLYFHSAYLDVFFFLAYLFKINIYVRLRTIPKVFLPRSGLFIHYIII